MRLSQTATLVVLVALSACAGPSPEAPDDLGYAGTGIAVTIAPLDLPGITDACYSFEVTNEGGQRVVARGGPVATDDAPVAGQGGDGGPAGLNGALANPLCSTRFGNSQGALSYVAPCDASPGSEQHTVTLWVNSVCQDGVGATLFDPTTNPGGCEPLSGFVNPCGATGCAVTATCQENADTPVSFNFTIMASAQQGFFDLAVNFNNIFCSAKYDCVAGNLLHHPVTGTRGPTHVLGFTCSGGTADADPTLLYLNDIRIDCGADGAFSLYIPFEDAPEGNLGPAGPPDDLTWLFQWAIYRGDEALEGVNKRYLNIALGLGELPPGPCTLSTAGTADSSLTSVLPGGVVPAGVVYPFVAWEIEDLASCDVSHPLNGPESGVQTQYTDGSATVPFGEATRAFVSVWNPWLTSDGSTAPGQLRLPLVAAGVYDFTVDWGDGQEDHITSWNQPEATHTYATAGEYTVTIRGTIQGWRFNPTGFAATGDRLKLLEIASWGPLRLGNAGRAFYAAENLVLTATDPLDLTGTTNLNGTFHSCTSITTAPSMRLWDTSQVTDMANMFYGATSFNEDIGGWDISSVQFLDHMFYLASSFDQDIGAWDTANVTTMNRLFHGTPFNHDISGWDTGNVVTMANMFVFASQFNQPIGSWDTSNVVSMSAMFNSTGAFNQDISSWDTSNVLNMSGMFGWAAAFNQDISGWDVSNVTDMSGMFRSAPLFNQDISGWDVSSVQNMHRMFMNAGSFDQDLGTWDIRSVTNVGDMFALGSALSTANYDGLLIGWSNLLASLATPPTGLDFDAGPATYSPAAAAAREALTNTFGWTITDGGLQ